MSIPHPRDIVAQLWQRFEARDWHGASLLLHDDFVADWPHTGERIQGRDNFLTLNRNYPGNWHIRVDRILADGDQVASEITVTNDDETVHAASFFELLDGKIRRATEYWVDAHSQAPPDWRSELVERPG